MPPLDPPAKIGRYELVQHLDSDHTGDRYEATLHGPLTLHMPVTLRRLPEGIAVDPGRIQAARDGTLLSHPNIATPLDLSRIDGAWVVVTEHVQGVGLEQLRGQDPVPAAALIDVAVQLAVALDHIHRPLTEGGPTGLIHGDVRPANLRITPTGLIKLTDLGVSALLGHPGAPGFAAPEQLEGAWGPRSDLYGLGATLLWLVTGQPLADPPALETDPRLAALAGSPPGLAEVLERCLQTDPQQRWASARELLGALQTLQVAYPPGEGLVQLGRGETPSAPSRSGMEPPLHTNLARPPRPLIGRQRELTALSGALEQSPRVGLFGPVGVGKTRLALQIALQQAPDLPGGCWYLDLCDDPAPDILCGRLGRLLHIDLDPHDPAHQLGAALAARGPTLLVLDHVDGCSTALAPLLAQWGAEAPQLKVLLVSREPVEGAHSQPLGALPLDEAVALFQACAGEPIEEETLVMLVERLGRLPLALVLAAAQRPAPRGLPEATDHQSALNTILALAWSQLQLQAQQVLPQLAVFRGSFPLASAAILELSPGPVGILDVLGQLGELGLIQLDPQGDQLHLLSIVREPVEAQLASPDRARLEKRHGDYHAQLQQRVCPLRGAPLQGDEPQRLFAAWGELQGALEHALARGDIRVATDTALALAEAWGWVGLPHRATEALYHALTLDPAADDEVKLRCGIADAVRALGPDRPGAEESRRALALASFLEDPSLEALALWSRGTTLQDQGELQLARSHIERATALASAMGQRLLLGRALADLGRIHHALQLRPEATSRLAKALELARAMGDRHTELGVLSAQARVLPQEPARRALAEALQLAITLDRRSLQGSLRARLGALALERADHAEAIAQLTRATELHHQDGALQRWGLAVAGLGSALNQAGQTAHAQRVLSHALQVTGDREMPQVQARVRASLAETELARERLADALSHVEAAQALLQDAAPGELGRSLALLRATIHRYGGELEAAQALANELREVAPDPISRARATLELARIAVIRRQGPRALEHIEAALGLLDGTEHVSEQLLALGVKAAALLVEGERAQGEATLREAEDRAAAGGLPGEGAVARELRRVRGAFGPRATG